MANRVVIETKEETWGPRVRATGAWDWLDVTESTADDSALSLLAAAAAEHPEIEDVVDELLGQGGYASLDGQPLDLESLREAVRRQPEAEVLRERWEASQKLAESLPSTPPRPPGPRL